MEDAERDGDRHRYANDERASEKSRHSDDDSPPVVDDARGEMEGVEHREHRRRTEEHSIERRNDEGPAMQLARDEMIDYGYGDDE